MISIALLALSLAAMWILHFIDLAVLDDLEAHRIAAWVRPTELVLTSGASLLRLAGAIVFLVWIHGAVTNTQSIGHPMTITPGWACGWFFIPVASLWMPYKTMGELVTRSDPREIVITPPAVLAWWMLFVSGNVLRVIASGLQKTIDVSSFVILQVLASIALTGALAALCMLILRIHRGQEELSRRPHQRS
jgi:hypothetical protein